LFDLFRENLGKLFLSIGHAVLHVRGQFILRGRDVGKMTCDSVWRTTLKPSGNGQIADLYPVAAPLLRLRPLGHGLECKPVGKKRREAAS
jgi:hypothetical protein